MGKSATNMGGLNMNYSSNLSQSINASNNNNFQNNRPSLNFLSGPKI